MSFRQPQCFITKEMNRLGFNPDGKTIIIDLAILDINFFRNMFKFKNMGFQFLKGDIDFFRLGEHKDVIYEPEPKDKVLNHRYPNKRYLTLSQKFGKKRNCQGFFVKEGELKEHWKDISAMCVWIEVENMKRLGFPYKETPFVRYEWIIPVNVSMLAIYLEQISVTIRPFLIFPKEIGEKRVYQYFIPEFFATQYSNKENEENQDFSGSYRRYIEREVAELPYVMSVESVEYLRIDNVHDADESDMTIHQIKYENMIDMSNLNGEMGNEYDQKGDEQS